VKDSPKQSDTSVTDVGALDDSASRKASTRKLDHGKEIA
jgi:hypothetical protein